MEILLATDYPLPPGEAGMKERYRGLTPHQTEVLGQIAFGFDRGHHPKTLEVLAREGLIEGHEQEVYGKGNSPIDLIPMIVICWEMPIAEHIAWCEWCATLPDEEERPESSQQ